MSNETVTPGCSLQEEYKLTEQLIELLKQEQAQLINADVEGLIAVTDAKSRTVTQMTELTNRRYQALTEAGFEPKEGGMRAWLDASSAPAEVSRAWQDLLALAQSVKSLNNTNGMLIGKHLAHTQKALDILQGNQPSNIYGPNGKSTNRKAARGLIVG